MWGCGPWYLPQMTYMASTRIIGKVQKARNCCGQHCSRIRSPMDMFVYTLWSTQCSILRSFTTGSDWAYFLWAGQLRWTGYRQKTMQRLQRRASILCRRGSQTSLLQLVRYYVKVLERVSLCTLLSHSIHSRCLFDL